MYAVIKTGGKQYKVSVDDEIFVEKLEGEAGSQVTFDEVLAVSDDKGIVAGDVKATVTGEIVKQGRNKKVIVSKYKAKKGYRRKNGHRQPYTRVLSSAAQYQHFFLLQQAPWKIFAVTTANLSSVSAMRAQKMSI